MGIWALDLVNGVDNGQGGEWDLSVSNLVVDITNVTNEINCQITTVAPHGLGVGDHIHFRNIGGVAGINSSQDWYETGFHKRVVEVVDATNFKINLDTTERGTYTGGGSMRHMGVGRSNPTHVRIPNHPFIEGELVYILGCSGATQVNGSVYRCVNINPNSIQLANLIDGSLINGSAWGVYTSGGTVRAYRRLVQNISKSNPAVFTVKDHGFINGQMVFIDGGDMTEISGQGVVVANVTSDTFEATGIDSSTYSDYTDGCFVRRPALSHLYLRSTLPDAVFPEGEEVRVKATTPPVQVVSSDTTWAAGEHTVQTSTSLIGTVSIGDFVGREVIGGNGNVERFYKVTGISTTTITLDTRYYGASGTDVASLYHLPLSSIVTAGSSGASIVSNTKNSYIKGGYNNTFTVQEGQTWVRHAFGIASGNNLGVYISSGLVEKINAVECYNGLVTAGSLGTVKDCTFLSVRVYAGRIGGSGEIINCVFAGTSSNSYTSVIQNISSGVLYDNVVIWGATTSLTASNGLILNANDTALEASGVKVVCAGEGVRLNGTSVSISDITLDRCYTQIIVGSAAYRNFLIENPIILNPVLGGNNISIGSLISGGLLRNCNFSGQSVLVSISQSSGIVLENCTFQNYNIGITFDQYTSSCILENCNFNTPGTVAVNIANSTVKDITLRSCTIDVGEEAKAFNVINHDSYNAPYYILEDSFGVSGKIYGTLQLTSDYGTYYSSPPSLKIVLNTNISSNNRAVEVLSEWVNSGVGRKFKFKMKRDAIVFNGSITPLFYLNGKEVETLSPITTLSNTWEDYELECPAIKIDKEGHLELRLLINGNSSTLWIDDFTVEDL